MGAVEIGRTIATAQLRWIIPVIEETKAALLIDRMGVSVGEAGLNAAAEPFLHMGFECVICGDTGGGIGFGFGRISDIRYAQIDVAPLEVISMVP